MRRTPRCDIVVTGGARRPNSHQSAEQVDPRAPRPRTEGESCSRPSEQVCTPKGQDFSVLQRDGDGGPLQRRRQGREKVREGEGVGWVGWGGLGVSSDELLAAPTAVRKTKRAGGGKQQRAAHRAPLVLASPASNRDEALLRLPGVGAILSVSRFRSNSAGESLRKGAGLAGGDELSSPPCTFGEENEHLCLPFAMRTRGG